MFRRRLVPDETFTLSGLSLEFHTKPVPIRIDDMHTSPPSGPSEPKQTPDSASDGQTRKDVQRTYMYMYEAMRGRNRRNGSI